MMIKRLSSVFILLTSSILGFISDSHAQVRPVPPEVEIEMTDLRKKPKLTTLPNELKANILKFLPMDGAANAMCVTKGMRNNASHYLIKKYFKNQLELFACKDLSKNYGDCRLAEISLNGGLSRLIQDKIYETKSSSEGSPNVESKLANEIKETYPDIEETLSNSVKTCIADPRHALRAVGTYGLTRVLQHLIDTNTNIALDLSEGIEGNYIPYPQNVANLAAENGHIPILEILINQNFRFKDDQGPKPRYRGRLIHPAYNAIKPSQIEVLEFFHKKKLFPIEDLGSFSLYALTTGNFKVLEFFHQSKLGFGDPDEFGLTFVHYLAQKKYSYSVMLKDEAKKLHAFLKKDHVVMDTKDFRGWTPVHLAIISGNPEALKLFIEQGYRLTFNGKFTSLLDFARAQATHAEPNKLHDFQECIRLLEEVSPAVKSRR